MSNYRIFQDLNGYNIQEKYWDISGIHSDCSYMCPCYMFCDWNYRTVQTFKTLTAARKYKNQLEIVKGRVIE